MPKRRKTKFVPLSSVDNSILTTGHTNPVLQSVNVPGRSNTSHSSGRRGYNRNTKNEDTDETNKFNTTKESFGDSENTLRSNIVEDNAHDAVASDQSSLSELQISKSDIKDETTNTQVNTISDNKSYMEGNKKSSGYNSKNKEHISQHHNTKIANDDSQKNLKSTKTKYTDKNSSHERKLKMEYQRFGDHAANRPVERRNAWSSSNNNSQRPPVTNVGYSEALRKSNAERSFNYTEKQNQRSDDRNSKNFGGSERSMSNRSSERSDCSPEINKSSIEENRNVEWWDPEKEFDLETIDSNMDRNISQSGYNASSSEIRDSSWESNDGTDDADKSLRMLTLEEKDYTEKANKNKGGDDSFKQRKVVQSRRSNDNLSSERKRCNDDTNTSGNDENNYSFKKYDRSINSHSLERKTKDSDYEMFKTKYMKNQAEMEFQIVNEVQGDLFAAGDEYALGHCVAEDMNMGSGIAITFRQLFKKVDELLNQRKSQGQVAVLEVGKRFIYYLVTKRESSGKPTYYTLWSSLLALKTHIQTHGVKKLALPRLGCGLDRLEWIHVKKMLEYIFQDVDLEIKIFNFQQDITIPPTKSHKCVVVNESYPITEIESGTIIVYFGSEDGKLTEEIENLSQKFTYIRGYYRNEEKQVGTYIRTDRYTQEKFVFYGCIVRKYHSDPFDFTYFQKCLNAIQKQNRKDEMNYVAFQAFMEGDDISITSKIVNLMRHSLSKIHLYVCWPKDLLSYKPLSYNY